MNTAFLLYVDDITGPMRPSRSGNGTPERIPESELRHSKSSHQYYPPPDDITGVQIPSGEGGGFVRMTDAFAHSLGKSGHGHDKHAHAHGHSHLRDSSGPGVEGEGAEG